MASVGERPARGVAEAHAAGLATPKAQGRRQPVAETPAEDGCESSAAQLSTGMQRAAAIVAKRWTPLIIYVLQERPLRFGEIAARIPFVSDKMVSQRLKELEAEGIVQRAIFAEVPVRVEYQLTEKGRDLNPVFGALATWAGRWLEGTPQHDCRPGPPRQPTQ